MGWEVGGNDVIKNETYPDWCGLQWLGSLCQGFIWAKFFERGNRGGRAGSWAGPPWPIFPSRAKHRKLKQEFEFHKKPPKQHFRRPVEHDCMVLKKICRCNILAKLASSWLTPT